MDMQTRTLPDGIVPETAASDSAAPTGWRRCWRNVRGKLVSARVAYNVHILHNMRGGTEMLGMAVIAVLVVVVAAAALTPLGKQIATIFTNLKTTITPATN